MNTIWERNGFIVSRSMDVYVTKLRNIFKVGTNIQIKCIKKQGLKLIITDDSVLIANYELNESDVQR